MHCRESGRVLRAFQARHMSRSSEADVAMTEFHFSRSYTYKNVTVSTRPRTRSSVTIKHLPPDVLAFIFRGLHIRDLLALGQVCSQFHHLTERPSLWKHASFFKSWPDQEANMKTFVKAATHDNFEAVIKLALARLYNEALPEEGKTRSIEDNARIATSYFCQAERLSKATFTWLFLRPPWAHMGHCCKRYVFQALTERVQHEYFQKGENGECGALALCVAQILNSMEYQHETTLYFRIADEQGSPEAAIHNWLKAFSEEIVSSQPVALGIELEAMRELRGLVTGQQPLQVNLVLGRCYAQGRLGGITPQQGFAFTQQLFQSSTPVSVLSVLTSSHQLTASMRYILTDWLAEVAFNLHLSTRPLLNAVAMVDRCLMAHDFKKMEIQLLGISCLLITSRYMSTDILTIREAVWYTDNAYSYQDVVRMMGEIMTTLKGEVMQGTSCEYAFILKSVSEFGESDYVLVDYITELCMLQACLTVYSPAKIAASAILLARVLLEYDEVWCDQLAKVTGFCLQDLIPSVLSIHDKCLLEDVRYDLQNFPLQAVKARFSGEFCPLDIQKLKIPSSQELRNSLGVVYPVVRADRSKVTLYKVQELICSPSRGKQHWNRPSFMEQPNRDNAGTPLMDLDASGYEGDDDDDPDAFDESFYSYKSDDMDTEPKSEPDSESSSESGLSSQANYITSCSKQAISPYGITINISNMSYSTSTQISSSFSSGSSSQISSASFSYLCQNAEERAPFSAGEGDDEVNVSLGFSLNASAYLAERLDSDIEDELTWKSELNDDLFKYPIMESSDVGKEDIHNKDSRNIMEGQDVSYGLLNEEFCDQDGEASASRKHGQGFNPVCCLQYHDRCGTSAVSVGSDAGCQSSVQTDSMQVNYLENGFAKKQDSTWNYVQDLLVAKENKDGFPMQELLSLSFDLLAQHQSCDSTYNSSVFCSQDVAGESPDKTRSHTYLNSHGSRSRSDNRNISTRRASPRNSSPILLPLPIAESCSHLEHEHVPINDNLGAVDRRKSLRSCAKACPQFGGVSAQTESGHANVPRNSTARKRKSVRISPCSSSVCTSDTEEDLSGPSAVAKRKYVRSPDISVLQTRRRRSSSTSQNLC